MGKWVSFGQEVGADDRCPNSQGVSAWLYDRDAAGKSLQPKKKVLTAGRYQTLYEENDPLLQSLFPVSLHAREMLCVQGPWLEGGEGMLRRTERSGCEGCLKICAFGCGDGRAQKFSFLKERMVVRLFR